MLRENGNKIFIHLTDGSWIEHKYTEIVFPSGEYQVRLDTTTLPHGDDVLWIDVVYGFDMFSAMQIKACLKAFYETDTIEYVLTVLYVPSARQDRVCNEGECASVDIMLDIIELAGYDSVYVLDIHNKKSLKRRNITNLDKQFIFNVANTQFKNFLSNYDTFLAPDKGAEKQVKELAKVYNKNFVSCSKERDPLTGKLLNFTLNGSVKNKKVLIVDDILDGCGTFLGIYGLLGEAEQVSLYGTHGLFTKGVEIVTDVFNHVYCTNSYYAPTNDDPQNLSVIDVITPINQGDK